MGSGSKSARLRELFNRPQIAVLPGGSVAMHAWMAQKAGYEAFYLSGANTSAWLLGWPDVGMTTMTEAVENAHRVAGAVDIPVFCDADDGFGNAVNVWRTVREFVWAGASGIHLEDQDAPKKSGSMAGRRLISDVAMVGKIRAAIDARDGLDPEFVICARTDARGAENGSLEEAIRRARVYKEAGADVLFLEGLQSWDECQFALSQVPRPAFCLLHEVIDPYPTLDEQEAAGQAIAMQVRLQLEPAMQAAWEMLNDFKLRGTEAWTEYMAGSVGRRWPLPTPTDLLDASRVRWLEERYLPEVDQRDYVDTLGRTPEGGLNRAV